MPAVLDRLARPPLRFVDPEDGTDVARGLDKNALVPDALWETHTPWDAAARKCWN